MRNTCLTLLVLTTLAAPGCSRRGAPSPQASAHPPLILITVDALRADAVSLADAPDGPTPNLARLAREGVAFDTTVASFCGTAPAMASLMTGLYPSFEGVTEWEPTTWYGFPAAQIKGVRNAGSLTDEVVMLAEIAAAHGYRTVGFHTNPHLSSQSNFNQGFEEYFEFGDYLADARSGGSHRMIGHYPPADVVVGEVRTWLEHQGTDERPLFLWIHLMEPHSPYLPPAGPRERFVPAATRGLDDLLANEALYHLIFRDQGAAKKAAQYPDPEQLAVPFEDAVRHWHGLYRGEVSFLDDQLANLRGVLEQHGIWDPALVIVTADHGEEFMEHGHVAHNRRSAMAEELIHIPLIVRPPAGATPAARSHVAAIVRTVDVAPTLLDYGGMANAGPPMDGRSLRPLVEGRDDAPRTAFISGIWWGIVRSDQWKYRLEKPSWTGGEERHRLFDLTTDPLEAHDVASDSPAVLADLQARWATFAAQLWQRGPLANAQPAGGAELDSDRRRALEALGYVTSSKDQ